MMNTASATSSYVNTNSSFRRKARAVLAFLRRSLEFTGRAYMHGVPPL